MVFHVGGDDLGDGVAFLFNLVGTLDPTCVELNWVMLLRLHHPMVPALAEANRSPLLDVALMRCVGAHTLP